MVVNLEKVLITSQETIMENLNHTMHDIDIQVDKHLTTVATQLNLVTTNISETCQFYESQIKSEQDLKTTIAEAVSIITQEAIDEHINPRFANQLKAIDDATMEAIANITKDHIMKTQNPVKTKNPPPTPWSQRAVSTTGL
jgi:hypothetical protein